MVNSKQESTKNVWATIKAFANELLGFQVQYILDGKIPKL
jgi:hypothetical protein